MLYIGVVLHAYLVCGKWVNRICNITLTKCLEHLQQGWTRPVEMTESEREQAKCKLKNLDMNNLQSNMLKQHWALFHSMLGAISFPKKT